MKKVLTVSAIIGSMVIVLIFLFLGYFSLPLIKSGGLLSLISSNWNPDSSYGLAPMIIGSLLIASFAAILSFVYAIGITLSIESLKSKKVKNATLYFFNLLSSIPTVVYGFLGVIILVPFIRSAIGGSGMNLLSASLALSFVVAPTMILFFADTFSNTPKEYKTIVSSLGGDELDYQIRLLLPYNLKSLTVGFIMGFSRAIGDTMIALMVAGNAAATPNSLSDSVRTLTSHIALLFAGDFDSMEFKSIFVSGLILFLISCAMLLLIHILRRRYVK